MRLPWKGSREQAELQRMLPEANTKFSESRSQTAFFCSYGPWRSSHNATVTKHIVPRSSTEAFPYPHLMTQTTAALTDLPRVTAVWEEQRPEFKSWASESGGLPSSLLQSPRKREGGLRGWAGCRPTRGFGPGCALRVGRRRPRPGSALGRVCLSPSPSAPQPTTLSLLNQIFKKRDGEKRRWKNLFKF